MLQNAELTKELMSSLKKTINGLRQRNFAELEGWEAELSNFNGIATLKECFEVNKIDPECRVKILKAYLRLFPHYDLMVDLGLQETDHEDETDILMDIRMIARDHNLGSEIEKQLYSTIPKKLKSELEEKKPLSNKIREAHGYKDFGICLSVLIKCRKITEKDLRKDFHIICSTEPRFFLEIAIENILQEAVNTTPPE